jgi:hypothetical protein
MERNNVSKSVTTLRNVTGETSRLKDEGRQRRVESGRQALQDNTLRSIYDQSTFDDPQHSILTGRYKSSGKLGAEYRSQSKPARNESLFQDLSMANRTQLPDLPGQIKKTQRRIEHLKNDFSDLAPIQERDIRLYKTYDPLRDEIRDEHDRLQEENARLVEEKQRLLKSALNKSALPPPLVNKVERLYPSEPRGNGDRPTNYRQLPEQPAKQSVFTKYSQDNKYQLLEDMLKRNKQGIEEMKRKNEMAQKEIREKDKILNKFRAGNQGYQGHPGGFPQGNRLTPDPKILIQNASRNPDLNDFERGMTFLEAQDTDAIKLMSQVPVGTDLYRFKVEQFKETATTRAEVEKLMHEQQLKAMKKGFDIASKKMENRSEHMIWDDEQRKNIIASHIRRQLGLGLTLEYNIPEEVEEEPEPEEEEPAPVKRPDRPKRYDPTEGFIVYWDYCLGLPPNQEFSAFEFQIVSNGEIIRDLEQGAEVKQNVEESQKTVKCIFGLKDIIRNIPIDPDMLLIWKVYMPVSEGNTEEFTEVGWTQIDLWTLARELKRGRWKCPLYELPVDTNITKEGVQRLTPIPGIWFYLRISYPWADEFNNGSLIPEQSSYLAEIPEIHLRAASYVPPPKELKPQPDPGPKVVPKDILDDPPPRPPTPEKPKPEEEVYKPPGPKVDAGKPKDEIAIGDRVGIVLQINKVISHQAQSHMRVGVICLEESTPLKDDTLKKWIRNTMIHNPLVGSEDDEENLGTSIIPSQLTKEGKMANLAKGSEIIFKNEKFNLWRNLKAMMKSNRKHVYLLFQLLEKEPPKNVLRGKDAGFASSQTANLGGLEFAIIGYAIYRVSTDDFNISEGLKTINFLKPPTQLPPFDESRKQRRDDLAVLEFKIQPKSYTEDDVRQEYKLFDVDTKKKNVQAIGAGISNLLKSKQDAPPSKDPFIKNSKKQYAEKIFEKGYGIDFYIDQLKFLPDNVTVTKCIIRIVSRDYKDIFPIKACLPKIKADNDAYNPVFEYRTEYRAEFIPPTALLFLCFATIDSSNNQTRIIGYSGINLFVHRYSLGQPENDIDPDIYLHSGCYQLPIHSEEPLRVKPFNLDRIEKLDICPAASCLIRIRLAPLSDDLKRVLGISDVPKAQWRTMGVWPERPDYQTGVYNSQFVVIKETEIQLLPLRVARKALPMTEAALDIKNRNPGGDVQMDAKLLFQFLDATIKISSSTFMLDGKYFAQYRLESGFKFVIDAIHNPANTNPLVCTYCINPPGEYYQNKDKTEDLVLVPNIDFNHPVGQIKYYSDYVKYRNLEYDPYKNIIIEVKELEFVGDDEFKVIDFGWTVIPLFVGNKYVTSGHYQIPIFDGAFPSELLLPLLKEKKAWDAVQELFNAKKIKWKPTFSSVLVRLLDGQKEGQLKRALDIKSLDQTYLPSNLTDKTNFSYNDQVKNAMETKKKLVKTIPENRKPVDYQKSILVAIVEKLNLVNYNLDD